MSFIKIQKKSIEYMPFPALKEEELCFFSIFKMNGCGSMSKISFPVSRGKAHKMSNSFAESFPKGLKEFMEHYVTQYEGYFIPSDFDRTISMLEGYAMGTGIEPATKQMFKDAIALLKSSQHFFQIVKFVSDWKFK